MWIHLLGLKLVHNINDGHYDIKNDMKEISLIQLYEQLLIHTVKMEENIFFIRHKVTNTHPMHQNFTFLKKRNLTYFVELTFIFFVFDR